MELYLFSFMSSTLRANLHVLMGTIEKGHTSSVWFTFILLFWCWTDISPPTSHDSWVSPRFSLMNFLGRTHQWITWSLVIPECWVCLGYDSHCMYEEQTLEPFWQRSVPLVYDLINSHSLESGMDFYNILCQCVLLMSQKKDYLKQFD